MNDYTIIHAIGVDLVAEILGINRTRALAMNTRQTGGIPPRHRAKLYYYILKNKLPVPPEFLLGGKDWIPNKKGFNPIVFKNQTGHWAGLRYPYKRNKRVVWGFDWQDSDDE